MTHRRGWLNIRDTPQFTRCDETYEIIEMKKAVRYLIINLNVNTNLFWNTVLGLNRKLAQKPSNYYSKYFKH